MWQMFPVGGNTGSLGLSILFFFQAHIYFCYPNFKNLSSVVLFQIFRFYFLILPGICTMWQVNSDWQSLTYASFNLFSHAPSCPCSLHLLHHFTPTSIPSYFPFPLFSEDSLAPKLPSLLFSIPFIFQQTYFEVLHI